jgi:hypothetical protein
VDNPSDIYTKGFGAPGKTASNQRAEIFQRHATFCAGRRMMSSSQPLREAAASLSGSM